MEALKKQRVPVRASVTKAVTKLTELVAEKATTDDVDIALQQLEEKAIKLSSIDKTVLELMRNKDCSQEEFEKENETTEFYEDTVIATRMKAKKFLEVEQQVMPEKKRFKLPMLELKKFNGEPREYLAFWSQFSKIHEDMEIPEEDKFQYLLQAVVPESRAARLIESFPPTKENYTKAITQLNSRFGREDLLVQVYVRDLLAMVMRNAVSGRNKCDLAQLYDEIECKLMCLETLGRTKGKFEDFLGPLIQSCLPETVLRAWERSRSVSGSMERGTERSLEQLMLFLQKEVKGEEMISLARTGLGPQRTTANRVGDGSSLATSASLVNRGSGLSGERKACLFCSKLNHASFDCFFARKMSLEDRKNVVIQKRACFKCLSVDGHLSRSCKQKIKCTKCHRGHYFLMCPQLDNTIADGSIVNVDESTVSSALASRCMNNNVFLQSIALKVCNSGREKVVRALLDTGSQKSYLTERVIDLLKLKSDSKQTLRHGLFGGRETNPRTHLVYQLEIRNLENNFACQIEVLSERKICGFVPKVNDLAALVELKAKGITLPDLSIPEYEIDLLLGADAIGLILTGKCINLNCGLQVIQTKLGNTVMGSVKGLRDEHKVMSMPAVYEANMNCNIATLTTLHSRAIDIRELWELDVLGIRDPLENREIKLQDEIVTQFESNLKTLPDGRLEMHLPFKGRFELPSNKNLALTRHRRMCQKAIEENYWEDYVSVFREWEELQIIERVPKEDLNKLGHYLPHRPVIKHSSQTFKVRPVFDAGAREKQQPSLNDCLHSGPNLIELIPDIMDRFRSYPIGLSSDIERAFLQLGIDPEHRDYLRFFYPSQTEEIVYRHCRVVFGVCSSPFLLSASINYLLKQAPVEYADIVSKLKHSFYVDNCVTGVSDVQEIERFISGAVKVMSRGCFNLRGWEANVGGPFIDKCSGDTNLLGMIWNLDRDTLRCNITFDNQQSEANLTKRAILSIVQHLFDPIGILAAATLLPKLWIQETWKLKLSWDEPLPPDLSNKFHRWLGEVVLLKEIEIPRYTAANEGSELHVFVDACKSSYAACVFIRSITQCGVQIHLIRAKNRVAPTKYISIPRLELLACCIGARLLYSVKNAFDLPAIKATLWTDSMVALWWIRNRGEWSVFVSNRIKEINQLVPQESCRHVPGALNPADVLSRGCTPKQLASDSKWYRGPSWLLGPPDTWPVTELTCDVKELDSEKRKTKLCSINVTEKATPWYTVRFSNYLSIVRLVGWVLRFLGNVRKSTDTRTTGELSTSEVNVAEKTLIRSVQKEFFADLKNISILNAYRDDEGIIRVKTRITERKDDPAFVAPILLPDDCLFTKRLIEYFHITNCHVGVQMLMSILREKFWIIKARKTIRSVVRKCGRCRRYSAKPGISDPVPLPADRVRDANVWEVLGADLAGPLFLKNREKVWIVLFTCAIYRAVHLELVSSLSTEAFLLSLRRFIARRGRPKIIYTDNGTNFRGACNELRALDWDKITRETDMLPIEWKFNPPTAAWWGGWWERLVRVIKELLRRTLGNSVLTYEELLTVLCDCEAVINSRPLTYISEDSEDLLALTPNLFLTGRPNFDVIDLDLSDFSKFQRRVRYRKKLLQDLRSRFRKEYLGSLVQKQQSNTPHEFRIGEVVLIEDPQKKRLYWPLGRVIELLAGRDGKIRTLRIKTKNSILIRPVQRVFPLEIQPTGLEECPSSDGVIGVEPCSKGDSVSALISSSTAVCALPVMDIIKNKISKSGRIVRLHNGLDLLNYPTCVFE